MSDEAKIFIWLLCFLGMVCWAALSFSRYQCADIGERSGRRTEWGIVSGCFIEVNGRMIPKDSWRGEYEDE